jgi:hypothetical protein
MSVSAKANAYQVYGSTEVISAEEFISELEKLGQENNSK